ncbi:methyltransferase domain-containing protein [Psychromonas ossibalaenae]|uniref:methyltransferase domain-containing protein n=1 Tax=Psychromonas ossibalaenae TaxID=444922 RepID=UPI0012F96EB3|nr:methyltransferase domain-containing protein [Psychromonas ossibalaenae]
MNLSIFNPDTGTLIHQEFTLHKHLVVREMDGFRWFHLGGSSVQSLMDLHCTKKIVLPVYQSMLLFLLWKGENLQILNLGMGAGGFERALQVSPHINVTSVEQDPQIAAMARNYFFLPDTVQVYIQSAQQFIEQNHNQYDIVLCDIFIEHKHCQCINDLNFYQNLHKSMKQSGVALINLFVETELQLLDILQGVHNVFSYSALIEFTDYKNIVLIVSDLPIPAKEQLFVSNKNGNNSSGIDFDNMINHLYHIKKS